MGYQREYSSRVRIGVVGVGSHAYRNILPALQYLPVQLVAVCDTQPGLAAVTAQQFGCRAFDDPHEMFESGELDAVLLVVGPHAHPELALAAFEAGLHVWMEKPVAIRASEVEEMIARRGRQVAVVGFKKVFMPSAQKALEVIRSPQSGALESMLAVYPTEIPANGEKILRERIRTDWLANGCHPLSLLVAAGGKPSEVITYRTSTGKGVCVIRFRSGVQATFHLSSGPLPHEQYSFFSVDWHLQIENSLKVTLQRGIPFEYGVTANYVPPGDGHGAIVWEPQNTLSTLENNSLVTQGIWGELMYFLRCVLDGEVAETGSLEMALDVMRVYEASLLSDGSAIPI